VKGRGGLIAASLASFGTAALFVGRSAAGDAALYKNVLDDVLLLRIAAVCKLVALLFALLHAEQTTRRLDSDNPARRPWRLLALAMGAYVVGQAFLSAHQVVLGTSWFPSPGDIFYVAAYPLMIVSFAVFIRTYREAGYPVGSSGQHALIALLVAVAGGAVAVPLLRPVLAAPSTPLELFLNVAYPVLDFVLLVPLIILVRVAWPFRGGAIFRAWALLLGGIVCLCAGDLLFAWFSILKFAHLDPLLHAAYLVGYTCLAWGTRLHRDLVAG
jgi:hypothetical protein